LGLVSYLSFSFQRFIVCEQQHILKVVHVKGVGVWGLGFGVWGLGFGVWGLGFGVWGFSVFKEWLLFVTFGACA
jgi:hypothetical protein